MAGDIAGIWLGAAMAAGVVWAGRWGVGLKRRIDRIALLVYAMMALAGIVALLVMRWARA